MTDAATRNVEDLSFQGDVSLRFESFDSKHLSGRAYTLQLPAGLGTQQLDGALCEIKSTLARGRAWVLVTARPQNPGQEAALLAAGFLAAGLVSFFSACSQ